MIFNNFVINKIVPLKKIVPQKLLKMQINKKVDLFLYYVNILVTRKNVDK